MFSLAIVVNVFHGVRLRSANYSGWPLPLLFIPLNDTTSEVQDERKFELARALPNRSLHSQL